MTVPGLMYVCRRSCRLRNNLTVLYYIMEVLADVSYLYVYPRERIRDGGFWCTKWKGDEP
jgi:hypothetical protein